jgi:hypothetical protein
MLHCNVCSPGWAGLLTCTQQGTGTDNAGNAREYHETQNWYVGGTSGTNITAPWTAIGGGTDAGTGGGWKTNNAVQLSFTVITDVTGNTTIKRTTSFTPIQKGIAGFGGASSSTDYEHELPVMKTKDPSDTTIPVDSNLPYTASNNGPSLANPTGYFICHGSLNFQ